MDYLLLKLYLLFADRTVCCALVTVPTNSVRQLSSISSIKVRQKTKIQNEFLHHAISIGR